MAGLTCNTCQHCETWDMRVLCNHSKGKKAIAEKYCRLAHDRQHRSVTRFYEPACEYYKDGPPVKNFKPYSDEQKELLRLALGEIED